MNSTARRALARSAYGVFRAARAHLEVGLRPTSAQINDLRA
jgi:hypothetical protein